MRQQFVLITIGLAALLIWSVPPPARAGALTPSRPDTVATAAPEGQLWVTHQGASRLSILVGRDVVHVVDLPPGTGPHITTFSPDGRYAYVGGMGSGDLLVFRADDRQVVADLDFGPAGAHQAKPSPDGSIVLVSQVLTKSLIKVAVDRAAESWSAVDTLVLGPMGKAPVCTVFRDDGLRAYVSLLPNGLAIVDVPSMTVVDILPTDGFLACGMVKSQDGATVTMAASGGGGHIYRLDTAADLLTDAGALGAADWHSFNLSPDGRLGFGTSPGSDELVLIDVSGATASTIATLALDPTSGIGNDQPDAIAVRGDTVYVSLRASGKLAIFQVDQRQPTYLDLAPPAPFDPATCAGCAVHGVTVRPLPNVGADRPKSSPK